MYIVAKSAELNTTDLLDLDVCLSVLNVSGSLNDYQTQSELPVKKQNTRKDLLNELYQQYLKACNKEYYWKNKKRCYAYLRLHHPETLKNKESYTNGKELFRKAKLPEHQKYLTPYAEDSYQWYKRFNKSKQVDIREMISNARSIGHRKGNVIAYILSAGKLPVDKVLVDIPIGVL